MAIACSGQLAQQMPQPLHSSSVTCAVPFSSFFMAPNGQTTAQTLQPTHEASSTTALSASHSFSFSKHSLHGPHPRHLLASYAATSLILAKNSSASSKLTFCLPMKPE